MNSKCQQKSNTYIVIYLYLCVLDTGQKQKIGIILVDVEVNAALYTISVVHSNLAAYVSDWPVHGID